MTFLEEVSLSVNSVNGHTHLKKQIVSPQFRTHLENLLHFWQYQFYDTPNPMSW